MNDDCHVNFNLMLQLGPFLGATECLVKVLNLCAWIIEFVQDVPDVVTRPDQADRRSWATCRRSPTTSSNA